MRMESLRDSLVEGIRPALLVLTAAVALVLLIGCANIANLLLARSTARQQEIAMRAVLGASRGGWRATCSPRASCSACRRGGGRGGCRVVSPVARGAGAGRRPARPPGDRMAVLAAALGLSIATGLVFGLAPAAQTAGHAGALASQGRVHGAGRRGRLVRDALVVGEVAVSLALLASAALMIESFANLRRVDPGFRTDHRFATRIDLPAERYPDGARQARFFDALLDGLAGMPGVEGVAAAGRLPFAGGNSSRGLTLDHASPVPEPGRGHSRHQPGLLPRARHSDPPRPRVHRRRPRRRCAGRHRGRDDGAAGTGRARTRSGGGSGSGDSGPWMEIVGIAGDVIHDDLRETPVPEFMVLYRQRPWTFMSVVIETPARPAGAAADVRRTLASVDPDLPAPALRPMADLVRSSVSLDRFEMLLLAVFAGLALVLAAVGLYGVMSFLVSRRTREMAVRLALGATSRDVWRLVVGDGPKLAAMGIAAGVALGLTLARALGTWLFGVAPTDPADVRRRGAGAGARGGGGERRARAPRDARGPDGRRSAWSESRRDLPALYVVLAFRPAWRAGLKPGTTYRSVRSAGLQASLSGRAEARHYGPSVRSAGLQASLGRPG